MEVIKDGPARKIIGKPFIHHIDKYGNDLILDQAGCMSIESLPGSELTGVVVDLLEFKQAVEELLNVS